MEAPVIIEEEHIVTEPIVLIEEFDPADTHDTAKVVGSREEPVFMALNIKSEPDEEFDSKLVEEKPFHHPEGSVCKNPLSGKSTQETDLPLETTTDSGGSFSDNTPRGTQTKKTISPTKRKSGTPRKSETQGTVSLNGKIKCASLPKMSRARGVSSQENTLTLCDKQHEKTASAARNITAKQASMNGSETLGDQSGVGTGLQSKLPKAKKAHQCSICGMAFIAASNLKRHMYKHTGERPFKCDECSATFTQSGNLQTHQKHRHSTLRPFMCHVCPATFNCKATLKLHIVSHSGEKQFACSLCPRKFMRNDSLRAHMRKHSGERPFVCNICQADFGQKGSYTMHMRRHNNEKRFACEQCPATFFQRNSLELHIQKHTGIKPHKCKLCDQTFGLKVHLVAHQATHTGERPYGCSLCDAKFSRKAYVKHHLRIHSGEKPYTCAVCPASFASKKGWQKHMAAHEDQVADKEVT